MRGRERQKKRKRQKRVGLSNDHLRRWPGRLWDICSGGMLVTTHKSSEPKCSSCRALLDISEVPYYASAYHKVLPAALHSQTECYQDAAVWARHTASATSLEAPAMWKQPRIKRPQPHCEYLPHLQNEGCVSTTTINQQRSCMMADSGVLTSDMQGKYNSVCSFLHAFLPVNNSLVFKNLVIAPNYRESKRNKSEFPNPQMGMFAREQRICPLYKSSGLPYHSLRVETLTLEVENTIQCNSIIGV